MILLTMISFVIMIYKRNRESFYIFMMCLTLAIFIIAELIYIVKKGGISQQTISFYYLTNEIKVRLQYLMILLKNLGFLLAVGRFLFPLYLILLALNYSAIPFIKRNYWIKYLFYILPLVSLIVYHPDFFKAFIEPKPLLQYYIVLMSYYWCLFYTLLALGILIVEVVTIPIKFSKKYFVSIIIFITSLCLLYLLYVRQDPAQIYQTYYSNYTWEHGLHYIKTILSIPVYWIVLLLTALFGFVGLISLSRYTHNIFEFNREELKINYEINTISTFTSVFVHSVKNDLLANRVILKRVNRELEKHPELETLLQYQKILQKNNEDILFKINDMFKSLKSNFITLKKESIESVIKSAIEKAKKRYPDLQTICECKGQIFVLADYNHLSEAIYNLLINAYESTLEKDIQEPIYLLCYVNRLYTVIEVRDKGIGISKKNMNTIFTPFASHKDSINNYGVGLTYVNSTVKEHLGRIHVESKEKIGTTFYILLPKYNNSEGAELDD